MSTLCSWPGHKVSAGTTVNFFCEKLSSFFNTGDMLFTDGTLSKVHTWESSNLWWISLQYMDGFFHFWYSINWRTVCVAFLELFLCVFTMWFRSWSFTIFIQVRKHRPVSFPITLDYNFYLVNTTLLYVFSLPPMCASIWAPCCQ